MDSVGQYGIADGIQALKVLRQRADEFGLSPDRIGIVGFSAGAMVTSGVLLQEDPSSRPAFAAPIYGGPFGAVPAIPQNLPPVFLAWAQDDTTAGAACARFYAALTAAGSTPEVHIYRPGATVSGWRSRARPATTGLMNSITGWRRRASPKRRRGRSRRSVGMGRWILRL